MNLTKLVSSLISPPFITVVMAFLQPALTAGSEQSPAVPEIRKEIVYRRVGETVLKLDLIQPAGQPADPKVSERYPAIVFVHGGGWYTGNREQYHNEMRVAAEHGYVAVTVTYRLTSPPGGPGINRFPAQISDIRAALRWLRAHAEEYQVDPNRIGIKGASAGGHLSLLAGVLDESQIPDSSDEPQEHKDQSSRVQAVVNYYGPTDLPELYAAATKAGPMLEQLLGGTPVTVPELFHLASPVAHLSPDDAPVLTIHGGRDRVVPESQARRLDEKARDAGVSHELLILPDQAHGFGGTDRDRATEATYAFFDRHLKERQQQKTDAPESEESRSEKSSPNIILMMADDLGWGDTGYNGNPDIRTPHLDAMSLEGLRFDRFYSSAPVCSPTRASCLTGRNALRIGIRTANDGVLKQEEEALPELLAAKGYSTGHFGKWHLGTMTTSMKDSNRGGPGKTADYSPPWDHQFQCCFSTEALVPTWFGIGDYVKQKTRYWAGPDAPVAPETVNGDDSALIMHHALKFIEESVSQKHPFFAVIWFHAPHQPVVAGPEDRAAYAKYSEDQQHYFGAVTALDRQIGRLREHLRSLHSDRGTMVCFCSDNGPEGNPGPSGRNQGSAGNLRGRKRSLYEGGIRVPGLLVWPDKITEKRTTDIPCVTSDLMPTICEAAGITTSETRPRDGISLMPVIRGESTTRSKPIVFEFETQSAIADNQYKLVHHRDVRKLPSDNGQVMPAEWELYDLRSDPGETRNLASEHPEMVTSLQSQLKEWQKSVDRSRQGADY